MYPTEYKELIIHKDAARVANSAPNGSMCRVIFNESVSVASVMLDRPPWATSIAIGHTVMASKPAVTKVNASRRFWLTRPASAMAMAPIVGISSMSIRELPLIVSAPITVMLRHLQFQQEAVARAQKRYWPHLQSPRLSLASAVVAGAVFRHAERTKTRQL